jgi:hypothetical protein
MAIDAAIASLHADSRVTQRFEFEDGACQERGADRNNDSRLFAYPSGCPNPTALHSERAFAHGTRVLEGNALSEMH